VLDSLFAQIFHPNTVRPSAALTAWIGGLVLLILALNAAGTLSVSVSGLLVLVVLFAVAGCLACFWFGLGIHAIATLFGGNGQRATTFGAIIVALWPLLFSGSAIALGQWSPGFGAIASGTVVIGALISLVHGIHRAERIEWPQALVVVVVTLAIAGMTLLGLLVWPIMIFLGL
jgi:hypothetical protein